MDEFAKRKPIKGLDKEPLEKQFKYQRVFGELLDEGADITWTGMYKYVDSGFTDKFNLPIYKRKRIFRKNGKKQNYLTQEQREEIICAFHLFDKDKSNSIDIYEFKDAMSALGIHLSKTETKEFLDKVDKDGSGFLDL